MNCPDYNDIRNSPRIHRLPLWLALGVLSLLVFQVIVPFFAPLAWAGILAYISWPVAGWMRTRCAGRDTLAAGLTTLLAGLILFGPLLWLAWLAQQELGRIYPIMQAFMADPPPLPSWLAKLPWVGDLMTQLHVQVLSDPQDMIAVIKDWLRDHSGKAATLVGGVGKNLAKLFLLMLILFFFYRDGARNLHELRIVMERFLGTRAHGYLVSVGATTRAAVYGILLTAMVQGMLAGLAYGVAGLSSPVGRGRAGYWRLALGRFGGESARQPAASAVHQQHQPYPFLLVLFGVLGGILAFGFIGLFAGPIVLAMAWAVWREWAAQLDASYERDLG